MSVTINGTNGLTFTDNSTQNTAATGFGFKNRIINGAMMIDQRNAGASVTPSITGLNVGYLVDRFYYQPTQASKFSFQQNAGGVTLPVGFTNYLGATVASAYIPTSTDTFNLVQSIEGLNVADLGWGTANAQSVTVSFLVYSSLTGSFPGSIYNYTGNRSYPFLYTVSAANTWTKITLTIPGDTSGTWLTTNGIGISVCFNLGAGSNYQGTPNSWNGSWKPGATGGVNVVATAGATFYITGVQLEKGSTATSFDYRPYGTELALCQRYYQTGTAKIGGYYNAQTQTLPSWVQFPVQGRTTPSISYSSIGYIGMSGLGTDTVNQYGFCVFATTGAGSDAVSYTWATSGMEL